jgi:pimeloyl-ACP methyl ester carboxylesterase
VKTHFIFRKVATAVLILSLSGCGGVKLSYQKKKIKLEDISYGFNVKYFDMGERIGKVAYVDEGQGKYTLLFIHGIASSLKYFYYQIKHLSKNYRVIALDMPGYGKSDNKLSLSYNMPFHFAAIDSFIKKQGLKNVVIAGHSYGGALAIALAYNNKEITKKLVLIAPAGLQKFKIATVAFIRKNIDSILKRATAIEYDPDKYIETWHERLVYNRSKITDTYLKERLGLIFSGDINKIAATRNKVITLMYKSTGNYGLIKRYKSFNFPILIIAGNKDAMIPIPEAPDWTRESPERFWKSVASENVNTTLRIIKNCGHMPVIEYPDRVNSAISDFLK